MNDHLFRLLMIALLGGGTAVWGQVDPGAGGLIFSHKTHVVTNGMACEDCHALALNSLSGRDDLFPDMDACGECHDVEAEEECEICHRQPDDVVLIARVDDYSRLFSHRGHLAAGLECPACHPTVSRKDRVTAYDLPDMGGCMGCHQRRNVETDCRSCHSPEESLRPLSHGPDFEHRHADLARLQNRSLTAGKDCGLCHRVSECQRCHEGDNLDRLTHPLNYAFTHALEAQGRQKDCTGCHADRLFCVECHRDQNVLPHNHTAGWTNRIPNDGGRHRWEAQRDLDACMACHESNAEEICRPCHKR